VCIKIKIKKHIKKYRNSKKSEKATKTLQAEKEDR
jgi:hypothetical protein